MIFNRDHDKRSYASLQVFNQKNFIGFIYFYIGPAVSKNKDCRCFLTYYLSAVTICLASLTSVIFNC
uniref:Uncharacterized protein n=1 Tax=Podoviridae sp. ctnCN2 TaxID=2825274 RepID=A0A8S5PKJ7_9CAUD|nr:MAG TPA: hypothetical protein [Podoviridae sp. ctnCN2]